MTEPKITVIIPTRERADVLEKSLRTATAQTYDNFEIIVSDNFSADHTRDVVSNARDSRVRYINPGKRLSMSEHWEFALSNVDDGWVTIIGDDDGLLPGAAAKVARIIAATGVRAVRAVRSHYTWPQLLGRPYGRLRVPLGNGYEIRRSAHWIDRVMQGLASYDDLPLLYDGGFVERAVLEELRARTGRIYHSVAPDIYSAFAIGSVLERYAYCHEPLAIAGMSKHSTGASLFAGNTAAQTPIQKFAAEKNLPYHPDIPFTSDGGYPRSTHAMVYEAYLQSARLRPGTNGTSHAEQLEVILALARPQDEIAEWARLFADQHGLDLAEIARRARRRKAHNKIRDLAKRARSTLDVLVVATEELPVVDVHEASVAAASIRRAQPGALSRLRALAKKVVRR